jgi:hypothetical protein
MHSRSIAYAAFALISSVGFGRAATNDYPTDARADYVIGCMASNGETQEMLRRCSCSIDVIASLVPYEHYAKAGTILSLAQMRSEAASLFREGQWSQSVLEELRRAQIEADFRCF